MCVDLVYYKTKAAVAAARTSAANANDATRRDGGCLLSFSLCCFCFFMFFMRCVFFFILININYYYLQVFNTTSINIV